MQLAETHRRAISRPLSPQQWPSKLARFEIKPTKKPLSLWVLCLAIVLSYTPMLQVPLSPLTVGDLLIVCLLLVQLLFHLPQACRVLLQHFAFMGPAILFCCIGAISATYATDATDAALTAMKISFSMIGLPLIALCICRSAVSLELTCWSIVLGACITSAAAAVGVDIGVVDAAEDIEAAVRRSGLSGNPNGVGLAVVAAWAFAMFPPGGYTRQLAAFVALAVLAVGLVSCASQSAFIGVICVMLALLILSLSERKYGLSSKIAVLASASLLAASVAIEYDLTPIAQRMAEVTERREVSGNIEAFVTLDDRLTQYRATLTSIAERPALGYGLDEAGRSVDGMLIHNPLLMVMHSTGIVGFLLFFLAMAGLLVLYLGRPIVPDMDASSVRGIQARAAFLGVWVTAMAGPVLFQREFWIVLLPLFLTIRCSQIEPARAR